MILVLEATRRSIGWIVPTACAALHCAFVLLLRQLPLRLARDARLDVAACRPEHEGHRQHDVPAKSLGVFGPAAYVMFKYVFLFVVFGSFLEMSGATQFIIDFATKTFGRIRGGPAMVVGAGQRIDGIAFGQCGRQRGDDRHVYDSDDARAPGFPTTLLVASPPRLPPAEHWCRR